VSGPSKRLAELSPKEKRELLAQLLRKKAIESAGTSSSSSLPVVVADRSGRYQPFPLTDIQQAYWIGRGGAFELGNVGAHLYWEFETPKLEPKRLGLAWQRLIDRHDMLRAIVLADGQQKVLRDVPPYQVAVLDLRDDDAAEVASQLDAVRQRMSYEVFSVDQWPLFDIRVSRLDDQRALIHVSTDLLIADLKSIEILLHEWFQLYQNPEAPLRPLAISFRDYVLAEQALQESGVYKLAQEYWCRRIPTLAPAPEVPLARSPGSLSRPRFSRRSATLERKRWLRLKARARELGLTPAAVLLSAFAEVLGVWSESLRFTINVTLFNRLPLHPQVNDLVGDFTSLNLLEVDNSAGDTFRARTRRIQERLWNDLDHRHFSGVKVLRELARIQGGASRAAMPIVFTCNLAQDVESLENARSLFLPGRLVHGITQTPQVWLDYQVFEEVGALNVNSDAEVGALNINWDAVEGLFPEGLLQDMFEANTRLLERLEDEEEAWQETTRHLTPLRQLEQRAGINATAESVPEGLLHALFAAQVPQRRLEPAVVTSHRSLTYEELDRRSNQVGRRLRQLGAHRNALVAVVMEKGWEQVVAVLGVLRSGAAYLPIDPELPTERRWSLLERGEVNLVLTQSWLDEKLEWPERVQRLSLDNEELAGVDDHPLEPASGPEDLAYVIYTSGSTGLPKGVMIDHRGALNTVIDINQRFEVGPEDRVLALSSLSFDLSVYDIFGTLGAGGTIVVPDASATRDPVHWSELMEREKVTIWNSVPALMEMWVEYLAARSTRRSCSLRLVMLSGDWIPVTLPARIKTLVEHVQLVSLGGATEASIWSVLYPVEDVDPDWKSIPYGKPMMNQRLHVLDEAFEPRPVWVPGLLYIGGIGLAKGYWRDQGQTGASFIAHPRTGERLYRTGDLGRYLPDGNIEFLGRKDFQVKIQGYRVELGEIEAALTQHPAVREAVATAAGEPRGNKRLVAYVVPHQGQSPLISELREHLREKLPPYMLPSAFVLLGALPLTPNGKVDRRALPSPDVVSLHTAGEFVAPRDALELQLAQMWKDLLGIQRVGMRDNFFALGGNSLLAVRLMGRIEQVCGKSLPLDTLFQAATIEHLAGILRQEESLPDSLLVAVQPKGSKLPFFCIHPIGGNVVCYAELAHGLGSDQPFYGLRARGLHGEQESFSEIEAMAACYIEEIRAVQPEGPWLLGGWSMGGVVAFEMAQQLQRQGQVVGLLALLDVEAGELDEDQDARHPAELFIEDWASQFGKQVTFSEKRFQQLARDGILTDEQTDYVLEQARMAELIPPDVGALQIRDLSRVYMANARAARSYVPHVYPGQVTLLKASERPPETARDRALGWNELSAGGVEVHVVPGNHYTMLRQPHVQVLAARLRACLDEAQRMVSSIMVPKSPRESDRA
jgi:amino acid adenylation domain-containing protein